MRLAEPNEKVVKVHPRPADFRPGDRRDKVEADRGENLPEVFVFDCDCFESRGNPHDGRFPRPECHFLSFFAFEKSIQVTDEFPG